MTKKSILLVLVLALSSILAACGSYKFEPTLNLEVQDFTVTNQKNEQVTLDDLKGKPCSPCLFLQTVRQSVHP